MTAGANSNSVGYLSTEIGSLTASATFSLDGTQYEITGISIENVSGMLSLRMADQAVTSHLQSLFLDNGYDLYIDQRQFAIDDSTRDSGNSEFRWTTVNPLWQDGASIDIRIGKDIYSPTIVNGPQLVSVPPSDGYTFRSSIDIQFEFSEPVTVTGDLRLPIVIDGQTKTRARYRSGSGTSTLLFRYTVSTYEIDPNGIAIVADILNGSLVVDAAGNSAEAGHSAFTAPNIHTIHNDLTRPVLQRLWANLSSLQLVYDEPLSQRNLLVENFTATAGERIISIDSIRAVENTMRLTLAEPIQADESVTLTYRAYLGRLVIRDSHGNPSARFSDRIVENLTGQDLPEVTISYASTDQCVHNGSSLCSVEGEEISFLLSRSPVAGIEPQAQIVEVEVTDDRNTVIGRLYGDFSDGQSSAETVFRLPDNAKIDDPYELTATVSAAPDYDVGTAGSVQLTVIDDADRKIDISLQAFDSIVIEGGSFSLNVEIRGECIPTPDWIQTFEQYDEYHDNYPHPPPDPVEFSASTTGTTAQARVDYLPFSILLKVPTSLYGEKPTAGGCGFRWEAVVPVVITTYDDDLPEPTEHFSWQLSPAPGPPSDIVTHRRESNVSIIDDDYRFDVEISPAEGVEIQEGNGSTSVEVVATLVTGSPIGFDVELVSLPGTAKLTDGDYLLNGAANADARVQFATSDFQPQQTPGGVERSVARKRVTVEAIDDDEVESSESFELVLASPEDSLTTNVELADTRVPVTIIDAAPDPVVPEVFIQAGIESIEEGGTAVWRIYRKGDTSGELEIFVSAPTANLSNGILAGVPSSVTIPAAEASALLEIATDDDDIVNESRTVTIALEAGSGYEIEADRGTAGVDVTDNDLSDIHVSFGASSVTAIEGSTVKVSVQLDPPPGASRELTIPISALFSGSATSSDFTGVPSSVEFAAMQTEATFDVAVVADADTEEGELMSIAFGSLPVGVEPENPKVQNIYSEDVTFSFDDANHTVAEGDDIYIQIMLSHALSSEIEIPLEVRRVAGTADPISRISGVPQSVIFEPGAKSLEFSVSVSDDQVASGTDSVVVVEPIGWTQRVSPGIPDRVTLSIADDDVAAVEISPQSLVLTEGGTDAYTVVLGSEPTGAVTIVPAVVGNSDVSLNVANLNFDSTNWNVPQRVTVSAAEDSDAADDSATITHTVSGANYAGVAGPTVAVSVSDNETASTAVRIGVDTSAVDEEGGSRDVTVTATLNGAPLSNDVVLTVSVEDDSAEESTDFEAVTEFDVTIEGGSSAGSQVFTLTPISDQRDEGDETLLVSATTSASLAVGPSPGLVLKIIDDDTAGVTITPVELSFAEGASDTYSVVLDSEPSDTVRIEMSRSGSSDVTVSPSQLTFTASDWATARTVTVNSEQDDDMADDSATIKHIVQGGDYEGRTARGVQVTVVDDDDSAGLVLDKTSVGVDEDGSGTFTVALATQPTATVTVDVTSGDVAEATVSPQTLTFTAVNWATAQTVTVNGVDDADGADETLDVTLDADSADTAYRALADVTVDVTVDDDDAAGLVLNKTSMTIDEDGSGTFTVALATQPTATVTVDVTSGDVAEATVSPQTLTFTAVNWATAQTVTVNGVDDADGADETLDVTLDADSADTAYRALADVTVDVTVDDDDAAGLVLDKTSVGVDEDGSGTFTVALATQPTATVTVDVTSGDVAEATVSPQTLTFTAVNWATAQTVTVNGVDDADGADETLDVTLDADSADTAYRALADVTVDVTVDDDDAAGLVLDKTSVGVDEDGSGTFTVALATQPTATVTVDVTSGDVAEATVSPQTLTFTAVNWATAQTVTVNGVDDADGADETLDVTLDADSADTAYRALADVTVDVTVDDDDAAGLVLNKTSMTIDEDGSGTFTVALATQPTATVTVDVTSGDVAEATVSPQTLTFTAVNWATAQTVTVNGVDDADGADETLDVTLDADSADTAYRALADVTVDVTVDDDDAAGLVLNKTSMTIDEDGSGTFTVALATQPTATVTVDVTSGDTAEATVSPQTLTFTTANWNTAQTVTVNGVDDADGADETLDVTLDADSADTAYRALADVTVDVTVDDDDAAGLVLNKTSMTIDEDGSGTFTVALATQPTATVTVDVTSGDTAEATVSPQTLTFTTANWNTAQTVTVNGVDDADGTDETLDVTLDADSADTAYRALADVTVAVTVDDDDAAGLVLNKTSMTIDEDGSGTFTVALATQPTATVTVDVTSGDVAEATVSPQTLTFTAVNWATAQTVTVNGVDDADGTDETLDVTLDADSADTAYRALADVTVAVTVDDDDAAGLVLNKTSMTIDEDGSGTFTVALATQPTATVTVDVTSGDTAEATVSPQTLTFTTANWNTAQTVTVNGVDDADGADETLDVTLDADSADTAYRALADVTVDVTVDDDDAAGLVLDKTSMTIDEDGSGTFTVALATQPTATVTVDVTSGDVAEATVSPQTLTFTAVNWATAQTVTVNGVDDADGADETLDVTLDADSADTAYRALADVTVDVTVDDDDAAGLVLDKTSVGVDEDGSGTFTVALATQPTATVTVDVTSGDVAEATVSPQTLTFTAVNWATAQTVTVNGVDDADGADETLDVTLDADSADTAYRALADVTVDVTVDDDDAAGLVLDKTSMTIDEDGSGTFTVALATQPTATVTVDVTSGDVAEATVSPQTLTFTAVNWATAQTVTVNGVDDADGADETLDVTLDADSADTAYRALADVTVDVTVDDDDAAGLVLDKTSMTIDEDGSGTFTVALATQPTATVTVDVTSGDTAEATVSPQTLTFTTANWNTAQTVTVNGVDDADGADETLDVTLDADSADTAYRALADVTVDVTVDDDDAAGLVLDKTSMTIDEDGSGTFTVALATQPTATVTVDVTSGDTTEATVSPQTLTFTTANWNTAQTVTVNGVDDADGTDETLDVTLDADSADTAYRALADVTVDVTVDDDDAAGLVLDKTSMTIDEDGSGTFTVALATQPTATVTVDVTSGDVAEATVSPQTLTFTAVNWATAQTVTVNGVDDADGTDETLDVTLDADSADTAYRALADVTVAVTVDDDDAAGLVLNKTSMTIDEDGSGTFTVALATQPTATVTVDVTSGDTTEATVSPQTLTFTTANWNTAQTVTVNGVDDADGTDETLDVTLDADSADTAYRALADVTVDVTVDDDDAAGLVLDKTSMTIDEDGSGTFTVALATQPTATVTVDVTSGDVAEATVSPQTLTFTAVNWATAQTVTVNGVDDADGTDETLDVTLDADSADTAYRALADVTVDVTVDDDDAAGLVLDKTSVGVDEDGSGTFTVALATQPTATVTVDVTSGDVAEATVSPQTLTFTAVNWATAQTVTVNGVDDADGADETLDVTLDADSADTAYRALADVTVDVTVDDDDAAGLVLDKTSMTIDEDGSGTFTVALATQPTATVTVDVTSGDVAEATVSPQTLTFTAVNWATAQTVTVNGVDDADGADETLDVTLDADSADTAYRALADVTVDVTVDDDDAAGLVLDKTSVTVDEDGSGTFTVALATQPTATVTVDVTSGDVAEATVSPQTLTFTAVNWATAQTVTVNGVDDADGADETLDVTLDADSADTAYRALADVTVDVTVDDDDAAGLVLDKTSVGVDEDGSGTFTVALATQPTATVTVDVTSGDAEATVSPR